MFRECVNRKEFLFSEISATLEVHFEIVPDELGLWRCSLYEVNSVCYSQFSLWFNNFFLILHTRQLPPENSHCWPPCMNNQQNTILTDETTDSAKSLINRPSNWPSHITSPSALWSRQGASCDPRFTKTMRCERQRGPRRTGIFKVHYHHTPSSRSSVKSAGHAGFLQAVCTLILLSLPQIPKGSDSPFFLQIFSPQILIS